MLEFTGLCKKTMDIYRRHLYSVNQILMLNNLAMLEIYPEEYIRQIFSLSFLQELDNVVSCKLRNISDYSNTITHTDNCFIFFVEF